MNFIDRRKIINLTIDQIVVFTILLSLSVVPLISHNAEYVWSKFTVLHVFVMIALIFNAACLFRHRAINHSPSGKTIVPVVLLCIIAAASGREAINKELYYECIVKYTSFILFYLVTLWNIQTIKRSSYFFTAAEVGATIVSAIGISQFFHVLSAGHTVIGKVDYSSTIGLSNFAAMFVTPIMVVTITRLVMCGFVESWIRIIPLMMMLFYFIYANDFPSWMGILGGLLVNSMLASTKGKLSFRLQRGGVFLVFFLALIIVGLIRMPSFEDVPGGAESIKALWKSGIALSKSSFPWGVGLGNFSVNVYRYFEPSLQGMIASTYMLMEEAFNEYLQIFCELGLPGLLVFGWLIGVCVNLVRKSCRRADSNEGFVFTLEIAGGLGSILIIALFSGSLQMPTSGMFLWGIIGVLDGVMGQGHKIDETHKGGTYEESHRTCPRNSIDWAIILFILGCMVFTGWNIRVAWQRSIAAYLVGDGIGFRNVKRWEEAEEAISKAIDLFPERSSFYFNRAIIRYNRDNFTGAKEDLIKCISTYPFYGPAYRILGEIYFREKDYQNAVAAYQTAIKYLPPLKKEVDRKLEQALKYIKTQP